MSVIDQPVIQGLLSITFMTLYPGYCDRSEAFKSDTGY